MKLRNWLTILGLVITAAGLVVNLGNVRGWFAQADRVAMLATLTSTGAIPANAAAFPQILAAFPPPARFDLSKLSGLQMPIGIESNESSTSAVPLQYRFANGLVEPAISFEEFQTWAGVKGYPLLSLLLGFAGFALTLIGVASGARSSRGV